jgi:hypothetical protein
MVYDSKIFNGLAFRKPALLPKRRSPLKINTMGKDHKKKEEDCFTTKVFVFDVSCRVVCR